jgi:hypothetical protein
LWKKRNIGLIFSKNVIYYEKRKIKNKIIEEVKKYYHRTGKITTKSFYVLKEIWDFDESKRMIERNRIKTAIQF